MSSTAVTYKISRWLERLFTLVLRLAVRYRNPASRYAARVDPRVEADGLEAPAVVEAALAVVTAAARFGLCTASAAGLTARGEPLHDPLLAA